MTGFRNHIWYKLLDEEGVPVSGASIWLYDYKNSTTELRIFDVDDDTLDQPIETDAQGIFDFYIRDYIYSKSTGYTWDDQFIISWSKDDKSGIIRGDHLWGEFESVSITGNLARLNKALSNYLGWNINTHVDGKFGKLTGCGSSSSSSSSTSSSSSSSSSVSSSSSSLSSSSSSSSESAIATIFYPAVSSDDGHVESTFFNNSNTEVNIGDDGIGSYSFFVRFVNVGIAQGSTINGAYVRLYENTFSPGLSAHSKIQAEDVDNAVAPTNATEFNALVLTTEFRLWTLPSVGNWVESLDISNVIQEIISRGSWSSGNSLMLIFTDNSSPSSEYVGVQSIDSAGGIRKMELHVDWT